MALVTLSTLQNVTIPFHGDIPQPMCEGRQIFIQGCIHQDRIAINLQCGRESHPHPDIALHFNPRLAENCVVRNSYEAGSWKQEERAGGFPFKYGEVFEIIILVEKHQYKIAVNGKHFTTFGHRIPITQVNVLHILGPITVYTIRYDNPLPQGFAPVPHGGLVPQPAGFFPGSGEMMYPPGHGSLPFQPIFNPPVPFTTGIPGGFLPKRMIYVTGRPLSSCERFSFNIVAGDWDSADFLFHFDVRIDHNQDKNVVVRNNRYNNTWATEEREISYFPFVRNVPFQVMILGEQDHCKVAVNNQHFLEFRYRLKCGDHLNNYGVFKVLGHIELQQVRFQ